MHLPLIPKGFQVRSLRPREYRLQPRPEHRSEYEANWQLLGYKYTTQHMIQEKKTI
jgi:hypothetical protein